MATAPEALPVTVEACHALIVERDERLAYVEKQLSERDALIARMQHQLRQLLRARYGRRSEKVDDPNQLKLFERIMEAVWETPPAEAEAEEGEEDEAPRKRRRRGRRPFPAGLPRVRVEHDIPEAEKVCAECGTQKKRIGEDVSEQLEYVPAHFQVNQLVCLKYACPECEGQVQKAGKPMQPVEKGIPGPGLVAQVVVSKYCDHLPLYRQEAIFARSGVDICRETMWGWIKTLAVEVEPLCELMRAAVLSSHKIHTDDTPVRLRDAHKGEKRESRIWTYLGDRAHPYTVFDYTPSRNRDGPVAFLGDWKGYLQADAFSGYDGIYVSRDVKEVACLAHVRRKFKDALDTDREVGNEALALIGRLYTLERDWKELTDDERKARRQEQSVPLLDKFKQWLEAARLRVLPKSPAGQAGRYALKNWRALCRYTEHGELDIDNNAAERALRSVAIGRKNWLFFGSSAGGRAAAIFFSLIASAKRHGIDPFEYLRDIFDRLPAHPARDRADFLPDRWKALREKRSAEAPPENAAGN